MDRSKWEYKKLREVCAPKTDILRANKLFGKDDVIEYIDISSIDNSAHYITQPTSYLFHEAPSRAQQKVEQGDILYSLVRPNLKNIAVVTSSNTEKYVASSGFCVLRSKDIDNRYLYHLVLSNPFTDYILGLVSGANYPAVREDDVKGFSFRCPSIADQQRIVAELDCLNEMIAVKQEQLKEFDKLAQSIFYDMFGEAHTQENKWQKCCVGDIYKFQYGKGNKIPEDKGDYPCYGSNGIVGHHISYNSEDAPVIGHIGAYAGIVNWGEGKHFVTYNGVICTLKDKRNNPIYGLYLLKSQDYLNAAKRGVAQPFVSYDLLEEPKFLLPPLSLQQQFADKISAIEAQKELVKQSIAETQALFEYTMDYYFNE